MKGRENKTDLEGYVGIDTLTEQIRKKNLRRGFEFNIMVVGKYFVTIESDYALKM